MADRAEKEIAFWRKYATVSRFVYVIREGFDGAVKVGVARDPLKRLASMQTGNSHKLALVFAVPGDVDLERYLHERARKLRIHGEWFAGHGLAPLLAEIETISEEMVEAHVGCGPPPHFKDVHELVKPPPQKWRTRRHDLDDEPPVKVRFVRPQPPSVRQDPATHPEARRRISPSPGFGN